MTDEEETLRHLRQRFEADIADACLAILRRVVDVEVAVTRDVLAAAANSDDSVTPRGLEHRIKSPESLARKITNTWEKMPAVATAEEVANDIGDVLRCTLVVENGAGFYAAANQTCEQLVARGYTVEEITDSFGQNTRYKGLHVAVSVPEGDAKLEIQFHTAQSADVKEETHGLYEVLRNPDEDHERRRDACAEIVAATSAVVDPPGRPPTLCEVPVEVKRYRCPDG